MIHNWLGVPGTFCSLVGAVAIVVLFLVQCCVLLATHLTLETKDKKSRVGFSSSRIGLIGPEEAMLLSAGDGMAEERIGFRCTLVAVGAFSACRLRLGSVLSQPGRARTRAPMCWPKLPWQCDIMSAPPQFRTNHLRAAPPLGSGGRDCQFHRPATRQGRPAPLACQLYIGVRELGAF